MAEGKSTIIIKKKKGGGHGAPHGGAWKVALADFMTAMMTFFLVMWLLGSDEEIQSSVAEYFNNPASAWRPDLASKENLPLGEMTGAGANVLNGMQGLVPEDLIERPSREYRRAEVDGASVSDGDSDPKNKGLKNPAKIDLEILKFSIPEAKLFQPGTDELTQMAEKILKNLVQLTSGFAGVLTIRGYTEPPPTADAVITDPYEFTIARSVAIKQYLVGKKLIDEIRVRSTVSDTSQLDRKVASDPQIRLDERRLQFIFKK